MIDKDKKTRQGVSTEDQFNIVEEIFKIRTFSEY